MDTAVKASPIERLRELTSTLDLEERNLYFFFDQSPDLLAIIDADGSFISSNRSWQKILGWSKGELHNRTWLSLIHPGDVAKVRETIGGLVTRDLLRLLCRLQCRDGHTVVVEFSATKWYNGRSNLVGRVVPAACLHCPVASARVNGRAHACHTDKAECG
jgi:PAS domain S-box-containing protein